MNIIRKSFLAIMAIVAMTFTSCIEHDGESDRYFFGTGTAVTSTTLKLDNGLSLTHNEAKMEIGKRFYVQAVCPQSVYDAAVEKIQNGEQTTVTVSGLSGGSFINAPLTKEMTKGSRVSSLAWHDYSAFGNGYLNFYVTADYFVKKTDKGVEAVEPFCSTVYEYNGDDRLTLTIVYDNREDEVLSDGKLKEGYARQQQSRLPLTVDVAQLYSEIKRSTGLDDKAPIVLTVKYLDKDEVKNSTLNGTLGTSINYFTLSCIKRTY